MKKRFLWKLCKDLSAEQSLFSLKIDRKMIRIDYISPSCFDDWIAFTLFVLVRSGYNDSDSSGSYCTGSTVNDSTVRETPLATTPLVSTPLTATAPTAIVALHCKAFVLVNKRRFYQIWLSSSYTVFYTCLTEGQRDVPGVFVLPTWESQVKNWLQTISRMYRNVQNLL